MEEIGINSPPERLRKQLALERGIRAEGYSGKKQWLVCHDVYGGCQIYAKTMGCAVDSGEGLGRKATVKGVSPVVPGDGGIRWKIGIL